MPDQDRRSATRTEILLIAILTAAVLWGAWDALSRPTPRLRHTVAAGR